MSPPLNFAVFQSFMQAVQPLPDRLFCTSSFSSLFLELVDVERRFPYVVCSVRCIDKQLQISVVSDYSALDLAERDADGSEIFIVGSPVDIEEVRLVLVRSADAVEDEAALSSAVLDMVLDAVAASLEQLVMLEFAVRAVYPDACF